jgi:hypothetical protein
MLITYCSFAQPRVSDTIKIARASSEKEVGDQSTFKKVEKFKNDQEAIVYVYRLSSYIGAAVVWKVKVDYQHYANLKQLECVAIHVNTNVKSHYFQLADNYINYSGFKPSHYYYIQIHGTDIKTGLMSEEILKEVKTCVPAQPIAKK